MPIPILHGGARRERARATFGVAAWRVAERMRRRRLLEFPAQEVTGPRWGHGSPPNTSLEPLIAAHADAYRDSLARIAAHADDLARVPLRSDGPGSPAWCNRWQPPLDAAAIYAFIRDRAPERYVEVGSGVSTAFAARAISDGGLTTRIVSVDPNPRERIDELCDEIIRAPLQSLHAFPELAARDILLIDSSHRALMNSDVVAFFFDWLPALPAGVLVGIHDVLLPDDYVPDWEPMRFSEQYVLGAWLLGGGAGIRPVLAAHWCSSRPELLDDVSDLFDRPELEGAEPTGFGYWFETTGSLS